jgi:hypothetical protein
MGPDGRNGTLHVGTLDKGCDNDPQLGVSTSSPWCHVSRTGFVQYVGRQKCALLCNTQHPHALPTIVDVVSTKLYSL